MYKILIALIAFMPFIAEADTINNYMDIATQITQMEMKADSQSQAWARSARHVLVITNETIAETLLEANHQAQALFCLPQGATLGAEQLNDLIQKTYKELPNPAGEKDKMTVSQIAWLGVIKAYPCTQNAGVMSVIQHVGAAG